MDLATEPFVPFRQRLTVRLTAGVILLLLLIGVPFLLAFHRLRRAQQLEALAEASSSLSRVVVDGLRSAMLAGHPHLLDDAIQDLSKQPEVARVVLLDREGFVRVSSDPRFSERNFERDRDPTCQVCHESPASLPSSRTMVKDSREFNKIRKLESELRELKTTTSSG